MFDSEYRSAQDFLNKMNQGLFDGRLSVELKKLSREQLEEVAEALSVRSQSKDSK